ncbi:hypothetical protein HPP92_020113 [Vanilla planifolia]|uniref:Uncharacterized protein n=1 Tax=Vanilla planifolia TaxID=51239 RepID=A0A835Q1S3_VANPL|nr:hypothetical protein HPP92_020113 [Vanilla planifolia]
MEERRRWRMGPASSAFDADGSGLRRKLLRRIKSKEASSVETKSQSMEDPPAMPVALPVTTQGKVQAGPPSRR